MRERERERERERARAPERGGCVYKIEDERG